MPRYLFINENIGGHRTVHAALRRIFADVEGIEVDFVDGQPPGLLGRILRAPVPGLARLDLDLQPLRSQLVHSAGIRRQVKKRLADGNVDAIHLYTQNAMLGGSRLLAQLPTVITTDSTGRLNAFSLPYRPPTRFSAAMSRVALLFERPVLEQAHMVFANTRQVVESLRSADYRFPAQRVRHLELGIFSPYLGQPPAPRDPGRRPTIVFIGATLERKGGTVLLDIWREHLRELADLTLITFEQVPAEPGLTVVNDLRQGDQRLWGILADADLMCFPSVIDQAPNAVLEAMVAELPVVAHPVGAIPEMIVDGETGILVEPGDTDALTEALRQLITDTELRARMGRAGRERVIERYNMVDSARVILDELAAATHARTDTVSLPAGGGDDADELVFGIESDLSEQFLGEWSDLAERTGRRSASRPAYGATWQEHLGKGRPAIATVRRAGELVALLPLQARGSGSLHWNTVHRLLGHGLGTVGEALATDPAALRGLITGLHDNDVMLDLTHLPQDSPLLQGLLDAGDWLVEFTVDERCPVIECPPGVIARDLRSAKSIRRFRVARERTAAAHGEVGFVVVRTPEELDRHWAEIRDLADLARGDNPGTLNLLGATHEPFSRDYLTREAAGGHLILIGLTVGDRWVACSVMVTTGARAEGWFTCHDPEFRDLIPGHQLIEYIVDHHDELGVTFIDEMIGASPYKLDWQTGGYQVGTVRAVPVRPGGRGRSRARARLRTLDALTRATDMVGRLRR